VRAEKAVERGYTVEMVENILKENTVSVILMRVKEAGLEGVWKQRSSSLKDATCNERGATEASVGPL